MIFDAEGVVIDTESMWDSVQETLLQRRGRHYERAHVKQLVTGLSGAAAIAALIDHFDLVDSSAALAAERAELMRTQLDCGVDFVPGFREFSEPIRTRLRSCVATSMDVEILSHHHVHALLTDVFSDRVFSASAAGIPAKPAPDVFLYAAARLGVPPANCVVLEDAPNGIRAAHAAGMLCVALGTTCGRATGGGRPGFPILG
ncbi:HAD family hydrolase [Kibdelosporangium lantanae]